MSKRERAEDIKSSLVIFDVTASISVFVLPLFDLFDSLASCMPGMNQGVNAFLRPNTLPIFENYNTRNLTSKYLSDGNAECHMELSSPSFTQLGKTSDLWNGLPLLPPY